MVIAILQRETANKSSMPVLEYIFPSWSSTRYWREQLASLKTCSASWLTISLMTTHLPAQFLYREAVPNTKMFLIRGSSMPSLVRYLTAWIQQICPIFFSLKNKQAHLECLHILYLIVVAMFSLFSTFCIQFSNGFFI